MENMTPLPSQAEAQAFPFLNGIILELFARAQMPAEHRAQRLGRLLVVECATEVNAILDLPEAFVKNFGLVAAFGPSRFNLNGERWMSSRARTQRHYAQAGRPHMRPAVGAIYHEEIESLKTPKIADLELALGRAALRVFFLAFGLRPDVEPFLQQFARLRSAAAILQFQSWNSVADLQSVELAPLAQAERLVQDFWSTCDAQPEVKALIESLATQSPDIQRNDMVSDFMTNMFAGIETTTASLAWMINGLARSAEVQARLHASVLAGTPDVAAYRNETMRFFPAIPFVVREVAEKTAIGNRVFEVGDMIMISLIGFHRDDKMWSKPNEFHAARPEFMARSDAANEGFKPFLSGPRACGGRRIAESEIVEAFDLLVRTFSFENPERDTPFQYSLAFRPLLPATLSVTRRSSGG